MKIMYKPKYHMSETVHLNSLSLERMYPNISRWKYGQVKDVPEDLKFRWNGTYVSLAVDLLSDYAFKLAETGDNPNFKCSHCGVETLHEALTNPDIANQTGIPLETPEGKRLCRGCFSKTTT